MISFFSKCVFVASSLLMGAFNVYALEVVVQDPCSLESLIKAEVDAAGKTVADVTLEVLEQSGLPYLGNHMSIVTINGSLNGDEALEVLSDRHMRAYGWCYRVDGILSDVLINEFTLVESDQSVFWYFGYANYDSGTWIGFCEPLGKQEMTYVCSR